MANEKRLIDANALMLRVDESKRYNPHHDGKLIANHRNEHDHFFKLIYTAPTVDAVEVVRCKDCKHWNPSGSMAGNSEDDLQPIGGCEWANCCRKANDFCSYGERKDNV